jgi:hypothetical protein
VEPSARRLTPVFGVAEMSLTDEGLRFAKCPAVHAMVEKSELIEALLIEAKVYEN